MTVSLVADAAESIVLSWLREVRCVMDMAVGRELDDHVVERV